MAGKRMKLNAAGFRKLMNSPEILAELERRANAVARAAASDMDTPADRRGEEHFAVDVHKGKNRGRASVRTHTHAAVVAEATEHTLTKAWPEARK